MRFALIAAFILSLATSCRSAGGDFTRNGSDNSTNTDSMAPTAPSDMGIDHEGSNVANENPDTAGSKNPNGTFPQQ